MERSGPRRSAEAWVEVATCVEASGATELVRARQVHGRRRVRRRASDREPGSKQTSIIGTDPQPALAIQTADCVPLLIADRTHGRVRGGPRRLAGAGRAACRGERVEALAREQFGRAPPDLGRCDRTVDRRVLL